MTTSKRYDLEERTFNFSREVIQFVKLIPRTPANNEISRQVIRSSSSIGANYIEANESLGKKDLAMRMRICRKETKETTYWLRLLEINDMVLNEKRQSLISETQELTRIFGAIIEKVK